MLGRGQHRPSCSGSACLHHTILRAALRDQPLAQLVCACAQAQGALAVRAPNVRYALVHLWLVVGCSQQVQRGGPTLGQPVGRGLHGYRTRPCSCCSCCRKPSACRGSSCHSWISPHRPCRHCHAPCSCNVAVAVGHRACCACLLRLLHERSWQLLGQHATARTGVPTRKLLLTVLQLVSHGPHLHPSHLLLPQEVCSL